LNFLEAAAPAKFIENKPHQTLQLTFDAFISTRKEGLAQLQFDNFSLAGGRWRRQKKPLGGAAGVVV
jgi:hypothetical protein